MIDDGKNFIWKLEMEPDRVPGMNLKEDIVTDQILYRISYQVPLQNYDLSLSNSMVQLRSFTVISQVL